MPRPETLRLDDLYSRSNGVVMNTSSGPQFEEDSLRLRDLLHDVNDSLDDQWRCDEHACQVVELLKGLSRQVSSHFELEEAADFFADPEVTALELAGLVDRLRSEHRALFAEISGVVQQAESLVACASRSESDRRRITARIHVFCHRLREHERRENELLLQAYGEDVGVGD